MRSYAAASSDGAASGSGAPGGSGAFEIKIQRIDGSSQRVEVQPDMTGLQLKEVISQKLGISMDQRLICRGRAIKDDDLLGSHVTESGQIVHMVQRPPAPSAAGSGTPPSQPSTGASPGPGGMPGGLVGPGPPGVMTGLPFLGQSQVFHIAMPDFMGGGSHGFAPVPPGPPGPGGPGPPGPGSFGVIGPAVLDRSMPGPGMGPGTPNVMMEALRPGPEPGPRPPAMGPPQPAMPTPMRGIPLVPGSFPHPVPPHYGPPPVAFHGAPGPPGPVPPHFPPAMPAPMHVVLQGFPPQGLAQVIPQLLGAAADAVPPPPRAPPAPFGTGGAVPRHPEALPWRDLRRLHSHLTVALGRSSGFRPHHLPPDGLTPEAEMRAFLTSLHAATSQLGVAVSDLIQNSESLMGDFPPTRQQTQFNLVLGSASRVFRALSNAISSNSAAHLVNGRPEAPQIPDTERVANALAPAALRCGLQPWEVMQTGWQEVIPGVSCPEHLTRLYAFALLQEVIATVSPGFNTEAAEAYPHLAALLRL